MKVILSSFQKLSSSNKGGCFYIGNNNSMTIKILFEYLSFINNTADQGGSFYFDNLNSIKNIESDFNLKNCTFVGNVANYGGAIYSNDSYFDI